MLTSLSTLFKFSKALYQKTSETTGFTKIFAAIVLPALLVLSGCASTTDEDRLARIRETERELYESIQRQLRSQQWDAAIQSLQVLEENFPFGTYAEQAQLETIYAHYRSYEFDAAIANADRFIRLHPRHRNVDYAYYMRGLSAFSNDGGLLGRFFATDVSKRDVGSARDSFAYFSQLLNEFPESEYAPDAEKRMIYLRNLMSRYEIHVANYYFKRGAYIAAVGRGRYVLENFQGSPAVPDALAVLVQGYHLLGMAELRDDSLATLRKNFPQHPALNDNGSFDYQFNTVEDRSWVSKITFGLFDKTDPPGFDSREVFDAQYQ